MDLDDQIGSLGVHEGYHSIDTTPFANKQLRESKALYYEKLHFQQLMRHKALTEKVAKMPLPFSYKLYQPQSLR